MPKRKAFLTVDFEDYRRQQLHDHLGNYPPPNPEEIERQLLMLLELFDTCGASATFFSVGRLAAELRSSVWSLITAKHRVGCHGHEHMRIWQLGPQRFRLDITRAKRALEDVTGRPVVSFRAPHFSSDGCDPWFGEMLSACGFKVDSSRRIRLMPDGQRGTVAVTGAGGTLVEVPLPSIGFGPKRLTVIGGTYFRLLPLFIIRRLLARAETLGFIPMVYLHPYDIDPAAAPLAYPMGVGYALHRAGDKMRRMGRSSAGEKLLKLAEDYDFCPVESVLSN
ncbi:MAG: DUF3473 domain-containing protein [Elusimicrobia bacterium]|nr:DUF3473 domain-containing protein [Elusimicrobiota bacterium]